MNLDLNLLRVFALVMRERSLTRAARRLSVGQPAVSHALARLRSELGDALFVRSGRRMEPTEWAKSFYAEIAPALERIDASLMSSRAFDPGSTDRTFRIGMSDDLQMAFLPQFLAAFTERMPNARLVVQQTNYTTAAEMLDRRDVSLVVGYLDTLPAAAKTRTISRVSYRMIMDSRNAEVTTLADYCAGKHALVTFAGDLIGYVDETLQQRGVARDIRLSLSNFAVVPYALRGTGYLVTIPQYLAAVLANETGLVMAQLPFESPEFDVSMAWSPTVDSDPGERIIRDLIVDTVGGFRSQR
ncbi:transcriptional regulator MexT [alpha proteobacterium BAL199]|nr:transcriptional regulator MexT [alpha proteobacterium BAL199]